MIFFFYILAVLLVVLSWKSFAAGIAYLRLFRDEFGREPYGFAPPATVFVPCRGLDQGLARNLAPILDQDYPCYEVVFVVDSESDPAADVINGVRKAADPRVSTKLVVAGKAADESQKVRNLREAVTRAGRGSDVFVFADSDVRPERNWLSSLVDPLADESIGCSTGYRWFVSRRFSLASELRSAWNASIASALGPNRTENFCWGGSTAIRRATFESVGMPDRWRGTLSDDFALTLALKERGFGIVFVPRALTASVGTCGWSELLEFTTRQMKITRVYMPHLWKLSFAGSALFCIVMIWAAVTVAGGAADSISFAVALLTLVSVSSFSVGKSVVRLRAVRLALGARSREIDRQLLPQIVLWLFTPAIFLFNAVAALFSRRICWRGTVYELRSETETVIVRD